MKKTVLVVCGTGVATSTVASQKVKEIAKEANIEIEIRQAKVTEAKGELNNNKIDFVVSTTQFSYDVDVPVISGLPFITGLGKDQLKKDIIKELTK